MGWRKNCNEISGSAVQQIFATLSELGGGTTEFMCIYLVIENGTCTNMTCTIIFATNYLKLNLMEHTVLTLVYFPTLIK